MTIPIRLAQRAHDAWRVLNDKTFEHRAKQLECIEERGFALLLYWNRVETALKLIQYENTIKDGWPERLHLLTTWTPLQYLKGIDLEKYKLLFGGSADSLWKTRNGIAHEGRVVPIDEYNLYLDAALWAIAELQKETPTLDRLREKKRRSDAQLKK